MTRTYDRAHVQAERENDEMIRLRAEQMLRETLTAQIKVEMIAPGEKLCPKSLRAELDDCTRAAIHAVRWERANPGQQWLPSFTETNVSEGLGQRRYRQYSPPASREM